MRERPRRRRRTATECPGDEVCSLTPDAYRVAMLIALSKGPRNPLTEAQRAEVELFMARLLAKAAAEEDADADARDAICSIFEAIATITIPAVWHALGTGDTVKLDGYDVPRLHAETMRIMDELPELLTLTGGDAQ